MKNLYHHKNKGKVYPSPSFITTSSFPSSFSPNRDALSALNLLPAAILALASLLSLEDREVLGYLITRSMNTTTSSINQEKKQKCKKSNNITHNNKQHPLFDCGCFDCYTSFWFRWDSSPNRELINQAIEAFEEHLTKGELSSKHNNIRGGGTKKKDKMGRRVFEKTVEKPEKEAESPEKVVPIPQEKSFDVMMPLTESDKDEYVEVSKEDDEEIEIFEEITGNLTHLTETVQVSPTNKGLVRKVLPDLLGIFNSRLWSLWNPSV